MKNPNTVAIEAKAAELNHDLDKLKKELKRVASAKCIWLKKKGRPDYQERLEAILKEEQLLKEVRTYLTGTKKHVTTYDADDIDQLTHDETVKAIKSIQSKKANTRWLNDREGDNDEFRNACHIEEMLQAHLKVVKPIDDNTVRKSDVQSVIELIELNPGISEERILEALRALVK